MTTASDPNRAFPLLEGPFVLVCARLAPLVAIIGLVTASFALPASPAAAEELRSSSTDAASSTLGDEADPSTPDLADDMRVVPLPSSPRPPKSRTDSDSGSASGGSTAPIVHDVFVSVVDVLAATRPGEASAADLDRSAVSAAISAVDGFWNEQTAGAVRFRLAGYTTKSLAAASCSPDSVLSSQLAVFPGHSFSGVTWAGTNEHLLVLSRENDDCASTAFGTVGGGGGRVFSANGVSAALGVPVLEHEFGHNLGLGHAGSAICASSTVFDLPPSGGAACSTDDYGDYLDIMGYSVSGSTPHLSAAQRVTAGWLSAGTQSPTAAGTSTTVVRPLDGGAGIRALQLVDPATAARYVVEYRTKTGRDATSQEWRGACLGVRFSGYVQCSLDSSAATGSVRVLRVTDKGGYVATTVLAAGPIGGDVTKRHTHLQPGDVFRSAGGGIAVRVDAASPATGASLTVAIGAADVAALSAVQSATTTVETTPLPSADTGTSGTGASGTGSSGTATPATTPSEPAPATSTTPSTTTPTTTPSTSSTTSTASAPVASAPAPATAPGTAAGTSSVSTAPAAKAKSRVSARFEKKRVQAGKRARVVVRVHSSARISPTGKVVVSVGGKRVASAMLTRAKHGVVKLTIPARAHAGSVRVSVRFLGSDSVAASAAPALRLAVTR
jgi:hypothetical protein